MPSGFKRGTLRFEHGARMDWLQLGRGSLSAVVIPGAGDGLWTVGRSTMQMVWRYRQRFWSHRLLILGGGNRFRQASGSRSTPTIISMQSNAWAGDHPSGNVSRPVVRSGNALRDSGRMSFEA